MFGKFSLASTFHEVRQARNTYVIHSQIWHPRISLKVSFFILRLLLGRLPLPDAQSKFGVQLFSKCFCCRNVSSESLKHVLLKDQVAKEV